MMFDPVPRGKLPGCPGVVDAYGRGSDLNSDECRRFVHQTKVRITTKPEI